MGSSSKTQPPQTRALVFASLLEVFFCLSTGRDISLSYASELTAPRLWLGWKPPLVWATSAAAWDGRNKPRRSHHSAVSQIVCLPSYLLSYITDSCVTSTQKKLLPSDIIFTSSVLLLEAQSFFCVPPLHPSVLPPFLNAPPGMESRCGAGRRRDCLLGYKERGGCGEHGEGKCWNDIKVCLDAIKYNLM